MYRTFKNQKQVAIWIFAIVAAITVLSVIGCGSVVKNKTPITTLGPAQNPQSNETYQIQAGDELEVKSFFNPELNEKVTVRPDGHISLQLANETVAAGLTADQLGRELTQRYSAEFKQPDVTVIVRSFNGNKVYVGGEVRHPQIITLVSPLTVMQAVAAAEGFTGSAKVSEVVVIRKNGKQQPMVIPVNLKKAINGSDGRQDIALVPYDIVYVPSSTIANVNKWVGNFLRNNVPIPISMSYRVDQSNGN